MAISKANDQEKQRIRELVKERRLALLPEAESSMNAKIFHKLKELDQLEAADCIYCYMSCRHEVDTGQLIHYLWEQGIRVAIPKVLGQEIRFFYITSMNDTMPGCMGILEPVNSCKEAMCLLAPVIVPGLAFDLNRHRIGYGGGYYDRFFAREAQHPAIAIAFDFQIFSEIPAQTHDHRMDLLITPQINSSQEETI